MTGVLWPWACNANNDCMMVWWTGVTALGTWGLLVAAVIAGAFSFRLLKTERGRDKQRADEARAAQASLVAVWPVCRQSGYRAPGESADSPGVTVLSQTAFVRNASQVPIYDVTIAWHQLGPNDREATEIGSMHLKLVPPDTEPQRVYPEPMIAIFPKDFLDATQAAVERSMHTSITFWDGAGNKWQRDMFGKLSPSRDC